MSLIITIRNKDAGNVLPGWNCFKGVSHWLLVLFFILFANAGSCPLVSAQPATRTTDLAQPGLVKAFYKKTGTALFWFRNDTNARALRAELIEQIGRSEELGLQKYKYPYEALQIRLNASDFLSQSDLLLYDQLFTDAALAFFRDVYEGVLSENKISYNGINTKSENQDELLLKKLCTVSTAETLANMVDDLQPHNIAYRELKKELAIQTLCGDRAKVHTLGIALNYYRWVNHFHFDKFVLVNIAAGTLQYYEGDGMLLHMRIVAGKPATPTPRFAAYCDQVILYPYWNVPRSIAVNEILPACKRSLLVLDIMNMQVIDKTGRQMNPTKLDWKRFNKSNFPYSFRQSNGCDNALGVIKFNLTSPYSVYLHDTNLKSAFNADKRYFSHGCIRIEKPLALGNFLIQAGLDSNFLKACVKGAKPVMLKPEKPVPVIVIYFTTDINKDGRVQYYDDVYGLL